MIGVYELMLSGCYRIWKGKAYFMYESSMSPSNCHHRDRKLEDFLTIVLEEKCLFVAETWTLWSRVYKEFLIVYYVARNLAQNMEHPYGVRWLTIIKKKKPILISIQLGHTGQLWPEYNFGTLEVTYLHVLWLASLWCVVE